jgi:Domain of unknown function (DUF6089)
MKKIIISIYFLVGFLKFSSAQMLESFEHVGEFGISAGVAHYFGDLNSDINVSKPKLSYGLHYTKQFNNYIGIKVSGTYALVGFADKYNTNIVERTRNLSFNSDIWEVSINGTFNFYQFHPGFEGLDFTPYIGIGVGIFSFDPYAYLNNKVYYLRALGTEGQGSEFYPEKKPYNNIAYCMPLTLGVKYAVNRSYNFFAELRYRFTTTDYLDDVSTAYAPKAFTSNPTSVGYLLQDRSYETGTSIGVEGRQRGNTLQNDAFATFHLGISFNLQSYRCPQDSYRY